MSASTRMTDPVLAARCRRKFLRYFPGGFRDPKYLGWEREYKWEAHVQWERLLRKRIFQDLIDEGKFMEIARLAVRIESRTNLLFSFEKMALRDAVKGPAGARAFAEGLYDYLHGMGGALHRFDRWCGVVDKLPRRQTRVLTWPIVTVFGFIAQPGTQLYLKPVVTRKAAAHYGYLFHYESRPSAACYEGLLGFAETVRRDLEDLRPRDMIDLQSFLWVQGSDEYPA